MNIPRGLPAGSPRRYPPDLRERAVMVAASSDQTSREWAAIGEVARPLSCRHPRPLTCGFTPSIRVDWPRCPPSPPLSGYYEFVI
jgi:hypothetical protein